MEYKIKILPRAENDLKNIFDYIFTESLEEPIAQSVIDEMLGAMGSLKTFPNRWPDFEGYLEYRQMIIGKYKVIYKIEYDIVQIVRIKHSSQYQ